LSDKIGQGLCIRDKSEKQEHEGKNVAVRRPVFSPDEDLLT